MPIKYKKSQKTRDKNSSKTITQHFYLKELMNSQLKDLLVSASTKPKVKLKILNEIIRRKLNGINTRIRG
jgi:aspartate/glutamate racemase